MSGFCVWLTGLSAAGKTTIARRLETEIRNRDNRVEVLDGDVIRSNLSKGLGFTPEDRETNLMRIAFVADLLSRNGVAVIAAAITPYREIRERVRELVHGYTEVYVNCPLEVCIQRDPKGLYARAMAGEIKHFTGIDDPFEPPLQPEIEVRTDRETPDESAALIMRALEVLGRVGGRPDDAYSEEERRAVEKRLRDLGYI